MVASEGSFVATITHWIVSMVDFGYGGWVIPTHVHLEDFASMDEPKIRMDEPKMLCGKLYCLNCIRHVRGEEIHTTSIYLISL